MTKRTLLTALLSLTLVLGLAASGFATTVDPYWGTSDKYISPYFTVDTSLTTQFYNTGVSAGTPSILAPLGSTSPQIHGTFNIVLSSGWTLSDTITVSLYSSTAGLLTSLTSSGFDTATNLSYKALYFDLYGQYTSGSSYYLLATSNAGSTDTWRISSDSFSFETNGVNSVTGRDQSAPVPLPAAVWLLGTGLLGLTGYRRVRNRS